MDSQIMEFIVEKRKDLSFIGPEFAGVLKNDDELLVHVDFEHVSHGQEVENKYPNIHTLVYRDFETAHEKVPSIIRIRLRGEALFMDVNSANIRDMYSEVGLGDKALIMGRFQMKCLLLT